MAREQIPGWLRRLDDPFGITWRVYNTLKRIDLARTTRLLQALATNPRFREPVFVIGVSRSGTSLLFDVLRKSRYLGGMPREGHDLWRRFHHPRWTGWRSDAIGEGQIRRGERRYVNAYLSSWGARERFIDKTPENSLRIDYLLELFPDARFIVMWRNPLEVINSFIRGWRDPTGRFRSYFVPEDLEIPDYPHRRRWCFALIDGWRDLKRSEIPEIAFRQWETLATALLEARGSVPRDQWFEFRLEDLLASPDSAIERICQAAGIEPEVAVVERFAYGVTHPINALAAPDSTPGARDGHDELARFLPRMAQLAERAGYPDLQLP